MLVYTEPRSVAYRNTNGYLSCPLLIDGRNTSNGGWHSILVLKKAVKVLTLEF